MTSSVINFYDDFQCCIVLCIDICRLIDINGLLHMEKCIVRAAHLISVLLLTCREPSLELPLKLTHPKPAEIEPPVESQPSVKAENPRK